TVQDAINVAFYSGTPTDAKAILDGARFYSTPDELGPEREDAGQAVSISRRSYVDGVIYVAIQIADALAYAHGQGVFHGDLKPSNVLLTTNGRPLLIDFNLGRDQRAEAGPRGGTLPYMAPEQLRDILSGQDSHDHHIGVRSEVYSFGALVYHLLTGD